VTFVEVSMLSQLIANACLDSSFSLSKKE